MKYSELKRRQEKEFNEFPMSFAFSNEQFAEGMKKLGLEPTDKNRITGIGGSGFIRKTDVEAFNEMTKRFDKELEDAITADTTGEGFIFSMFNYELANHEYCFTYEIHDALDALGMTHEEIQDNPALAHGLHLAKKYQRENEVW